MNKLNRHIYLIGMPGCGKSSLGKRIAASLKLPYVDTDVLLTESLQMDTKQILEQYGEQAFRNAETNILSHLSAAKPCLISTGGGLPLKEINQRIMQNNGYIVLIDRPLEMIKSNIRIEKRPLLVKKGIQELDRIYAIRMPIYAKLADEILVNTSNMFEAMKRLEDIVQKQCSL
ncbi:MAG: shikimate kinase [Eubacteriales bacterium]|nr:shikimate kinase [Eubacteriales bacterium]